MALHRIASSVAAFAAGPPAATHAVSQDGRGAFHTIQAAVDSKEGAEEAC